MSDQELPYELRENERAAIAERRHIAIAAGLIQATDASSVNNVKGLALSGGGIRAAFIARGLIEELHQRKLFAQFDYMSSVSGGGYTAAGVVDQVCHHPDAPLFEAKYALKAPAYAPGTLLAAFVLDLLIHAVPLFAFVALALFSVVNGAPEDSRDVFWISCLLAGIGAAAGAMSTWRRSAHQKDDFGFVVPIMLAFLCFFSGALWTILFGALPVLAAIIVCMYFRGAYVSANPHRYFKASDPQFRWLFAGLLGMLSTVVVLQAHRHLWSEITLWVAGATFLLFPGNWSLSWQNRLHRIFQAYRTILRARFLPGSPTSAKLHTLPQSWNPYPIFNASANLGSRLVAFELTRHHCGSLETGYARTAEHMPDLDLADAMAISGGAIDFLKRTATLPSLAGALLGGTGYWVAMRSGRARYVLTSLERLLTLAGTHPLVAMQLSDGGFVENLGVLALIRRRADLVVCLDSGYDPDYTFEDLRRLCVTVQTLGVATLTIQGIESANAVFRFRQNSSSILVGTIVYPGRDGVRAKYGKYIHVKINGTRHKMAGKFENFPHLTTLDQRLTSDEITSLCYLGRELAFELCRNETFQAEMCSPGNASN